MCSDSDDDEAGSDPATEPIAGDGDDVVGDDVVVSNSESEDDKPIVIPRNAAAAAAIDLPFVSGHLRFAAVTLPLADLDMLAVQCDGVEEVITPTRLINQGHHPQQPPSNKKRPFQDLVDVEIALEEGQYRAQMVRWSCFSAALRRSLRMILSDCR